ncbi:MAG: nicotinamide mononucleotide transporter [Haliscomenobacter sp.]|nr:nicotinamide mononucleotide transporter [Haliscomenobacter sp.]
MLGIRHSECRFEHPGFFACPLVCGIRPVPVLRFCRYLRLGVLEKNQAGASQPLAIHTWPLTRHAPFLVLGAALSAALGWALSEFTNAQFPYLDSHITIFSFLATYLVTRKVLSNWIYWILIDAVSVGVYWLRDLRLYAILMVIYTTIAVYGYLHWRKLAPKTSSKSTIRT